jgi:hypothetical protein
MTLTNIKEFSSLDAPRFYRGNAGNLLDDNSYLILDSLDFLFLEDIERVSLAIYAGVTV